MKFSIKAFFRKCGQICRQLAIWSNLPKNYVIENFIFCSVIKPTKYISGSIFSVFKYNYRLTGNNRLVVCILARKKT